MKEKYMKSLRMDEDINYELIELYEKKCKKDKKNDFYKKTNYVKL